MDVSARICGLGLDPAIMNASGILSFPSVLRRRQGCLGGLVTKSVSYLERGGNQTPVFSRYSDQEWINAVGLSNPGYWDPEKTYHPMVEELMEVYPLERPLIVSLFGSDTGELREMANGMEQWCDAYELNVSCPHPRPGEKAGRVLGSDPGAVLEFTRAIRDATGNPLVVKLSYSLDSLEDSARAAMEGGADALSATNTIGPTDPYVERVGYPVLSNRVGGLSGPGIKPMGLESVRRLRALDSGIPIIGMGGIETGRDIAEYISEGADAVAMGTAFRDLPTPEFGDYMERVVSELKQEMEGCGAGNLSELRERWK